MFRDNAIFAALAAVALAAATPAFAGPQLIRSAGLSESEVQDLTLTQIATHKFNQDRSASDRRAPCRSARSASLPIHGSWPLMPASHPKRRGR
jgi:hypothetical protein